MQADFLDNSTVRKAAEEIKTLTKVIHGVMNTAGTMAPKSFNLSKDGIESQFAANYVGHFLLTNLLMPEIEEGHGVVSNLTSTGYETSDVHYEDVNFDASVVTHRDE